MDWFEAGANLEVVAEMGSGRCIKEDLSVCKLQEKVLAEMIRRNYLHQKEKQKTGTLMLFLSKQSNIACILCIIV